MCRQVTYLNTCVLCHSVYPTTTTECHLPSWDTEYPHCNRQDAPVTVQRSTTRTCIDCDAAAYRSTYTATEDMIKKFREVGLGFMEKMAEGGRRRGGDGEGKDDAGGQQAGGEEGEKKQVEGTREEKEKDGGTMDADGDVDMMHVDDAGYVCICHQKGRDTKGLPCKCRPGS